MILSSFWRRVLGMSDKPKVLDAIGAATAAQGAKADTAYQPTTILGTVSQSGGIPTGAILEGGSNANGEYVKYADGTQICWRTGSTTGVGSPETFTWPAAFASTAYMVAANPSSTSASNVFCVKISGKTTTTANILIVISSAGGALSTPTANADLIAVGRWF